MRFAFLVHPLSTQSQVMAELDVGGLLRTGFGGDVLSYCHNVRKSLAQRRARAPASRAEVRLLDELTGITSATGAAADGRLYEIPMDARQIFERPADAFVHMERAVDIAATWGARIVGLGSLTGIVGNHGVQLAERGPLTVTTGNSLTVFAALENLYHACSGAGIDLGDETVAVIGIPGSIASAAASLLRPRCRRMLLVGRHDTPAARAIAERLDAAYLLDIPGALRQARVILSATSSGNCIVQSQLLPGSLVVDVGVPTDVQGDHPERDDVLIISGGLARVPDATPRQSMFLSLHHGVVPCCLGETMVLALDNRQECFSIGRELSVDRVQEIGAAAKRHGFHFCDLFSFGLALENSRLLGFRKALARRRLKSASQAPDGRGRSVAQPAEADPKRYSARALAEGAQGRYGEFVNPVMVALGKQSGLTRTFVRGEGIELLDDEGNRYLDFVSGYGSLNLGHNHPRIKAAIAAAMEECAPGFTQTAVNPLTAQLAERLVTLAPEGLEMVFFSNSGTEAVEAALKLARAASGRTELLCCRGSFHGKTLGSLSVTGNRVYQRAFEPLVPGCKTVPYGNLDALRAALAGGDFAAFIVEPIQGEGGMVVPPQGYLAAAEGICRETGTLLVVDEVQTGMGRTGTLFACDKEGVRPDILTLAKSLGGGLIPMGATLMRRDLWKKAYGSVQSFALHSTTFGGGSLACSAGLATLDVLEQDQLPEQARARGDQLLAGLSRLAKNCAILREVRGRGLMIGMEFQPLPESLVAHWGQSDSQALLKYTAPEAYRAVQSMPALYVMQSMLLDHGIYMQLTRSNPNTLRIQPPLIITEQQVSRFLEAIQETCVEFQEVVFAAEAVISRSVRGVLDKEQPAAGPTAVVAPSLRPKEPAKEAVPSAEQIASACAASDEARRAVAALVWGPSLVFGALRSGDPSSSRNPNG